jgi:hypothetical protein
MNRTDCRETWRRQAALKLIIPLHSKRYGPSGMLSHRQNSYATRSNRRSRHREAQIREQVNKVKKNSL